MSRKELGIVAQADSSILLLLKNKKKRGKKEKIRMKDFKNALILIQAFRDKNQLLKELAYFLYWTKICNSAHRQEAHAEIS